MTLSPKPLIVLAIAAAIFAIALTQDAHALGKRAPEADLITNVVADNTGATHWHTGQARGETSPGERPAQQTQEVTDLHSDTPAEATRLPMGRFTGKGEINPHSDIDYFRIDIAEEQAGYIAILLIETTIPYSVLYYAHIALFNSDGTCATRECEWDGGSTEHIGAWLDAGTYYLRVNGPSTIGGHELNPERRNYTVGWIKAYGIYNSGARCLDDPSQFNNDWYPCQTSLKNSKNPGEDINVEPAWADNHLGQNTVVTVVDGGIDDLHQDLQGVVDVENSATLSNSRTLFSPRVEHGTAMAGIIAAQHNPVGVRGVAPEATILNLRMATLSGAIFANDAQYRKALTHRHETVAVSNNSWGPPTHGAPLQMFHGIKRGVEQGISKGFHGKGTTYVFASADHNSNLSGLLNHHGVIAACGVDDEGEHLIWIGQNSGSGASLWVCAPFHNYTTLHNNTYGRESGVSGATAVVSGVAALIRGANPDLTWRDVKVILANSARQNDPDDPQWTAGALKYGSDYERYHYNEHYGFGVVDAAAAVELAKSWANLPAVKTVSHSSDDTDLAIPDRTGGDAPTTLRSEVHVPNGSGKAPRFIEHVQINIHFDHPSFRDLDVQLVSPSGTVSKLSWPDEKYPDKALVANYGFASTKNFGENPVGAWRLHVEDHIPGQDGTLKGWSITIRGHGDGAHLDHLNPGDPAQAPQYLSATLENGVVTLNWDEPQQYAAHVTGYRISQKTGQQGDESFEVIENVTGTTFVDYQSDEPGAEYSYRVNALWGNVASRVSNTASITLAADFKPTHVDSLPTGLPTITGEPRVETTLKAAVDDIADTNGLTKAQYSYQWLVQEGDNYQAIIGANDPTYPLQDKDVGKRLKVQVTFADDHRNEYTLTSEATEPVATHRLTSVLVKETDDTQATVEVAINMARSMPVTVHVQYRRDDQTDWLTTEARITEGEQTAQVVLHSLDPAALYQISASLQSDGSDGLTVNTIAGRQTHYTKNQIYPGPDGLPGHVQDLTAEVEDGRIKTTWQTPQTGAPPTAYLVEWKRSSETGPPKKYTHVTGTSHQLGELPNLVEYTVRVTPMNGRGYGPSREIVAAPTSGLVTNLETPVVVEPVTALQHREILLDWQDVPSATRYEVLYGNDILPANGITVDFNGSSAIVTGMPEGRFWFFRVRAANSAEHSEWSPWLQVFPTKASDWINQNQRAEGQPVITGTPAVGQTLQADASAITDPDGMITATLTYQWMSNNGTVDSDIENATDSTYSPRTEDIGNTIKVGVTFNDDANNQETLTSAATAPVAAAAPSMPLNLSLSTTDDGDLLVSWDPPDSDGGAAITGYRVEVSTDGAAWTEIASDLATTEHRYQGAHPDTTYHFSVTAVNDAGDSPTTTISVEVLWRATAVVSERTLSQTITVFAYGPPSIYPGSSVSDEDFEYRGTTYTVTAVSNNPASPAAGITLDPMPTEDQARPLTLHIGDAALPFDQNDGRSFGFSWVDDRFGPSTTPFHDGAALNVWITRDPNQVVPNSAPTGLPTISGIPKQEQTLTANVSEISDADGTTRAVFEYQWLSNSAEISGANSNAYVPSNQEVGKTISVRATFTDDSGYQETLTSASTAEVSPDTENQPPAGLPTIGGNPQVTKTLVAVATDITDPDGMDNASFEYQWLASGTNLSGATADRLELQDSHKGHTIQVKVSFNDDAGNRETVTSAATSAVIGPPLTATFSSAPSSHNGQNAFTFTLSFSEELPISYVTLRDHAFSVTNGNVSKAQRATQGSNITWTIHVQPDDNDDVTLMLPISHRCNYQGAVCTSDGRKLSNRNVLTVSGPNE